MDASAVATNLIIRRLGPRDSREQDIAASRWYLRYRPAGGLFGKRLTFDVATALFLSPSPIGKVPAQIPHKIAAESPLSDGFCAGRIEGATLLSERHHD